MRQGIELQKYLSQRFLPNPRPTCTLLDETKCYKNLNCITPNQRAQVGNLVEGQIQFFDGIESTYPIEFLSSLYYISHEDITNLRTCKLHRDIHKTCAILSRSHSISEQPQPSAS